MEQYLIHTCKTRLWYVKKYLVPSLKKQGIKNIKVYNDSKCEGQLTSLIKSYKLTDGKDTWHLQDDIIVRSDFKEMTEKYNRGIVCGFCNCFSGGQPGRVNKWTMWYSMPCIRIPGIIFADFVEWLNKEDVRRGLRYFFESNKNDDVLFQHFIENHRYDTPIINLAPNLVNHIDHLIGGSLINQDRVKDPSELMSKYWDEPELLIDIEQRLQKGGHKK